ncbi:MAG: response regulator transcription factor [Bacteroidota bacterium]|nr:response regulator transcription factor [Bacteroidota bacterium]
MKIALAEDNPNLAISIAKNIRSFENTELLFVASNGIDLLHKIPSQIPDIILMDINMPEMDGIEATRRIRLLFPNVKIIMLTVFDEEDKIFQSILAGASGYLLKDEKPGRILAALEDALEGGAPMSPAIAAKSLEIIRNKKSKSDAPAQNFNLTKRELEILEQIATGNSYQFIADRLFVSPKTVRKHIENIYTKLQVHNKLDAVKLAMQNNLV